MLLANSECAHLGPREQDVLPPAQAPVGGDAFAVSVVAVINAPLHPPSQVGSGSLRGRRPARCRIPHAQGRQPPPTSA